MTAALLVVTDGRDTVLDRTMKSLTRHLRGPLNRWVVYDDTGDPDHADHLARRYPAFEVVQHPSGRQGFGGAIRTAWRHLSGGPQRFIVHWEDDFILTREWDITLPMGLLESRPHVAQVALRRQAWNAEERAAGGIVERHPEAYTDRLYLGHPWLEHRMFWTTNPCVYRSSLMARGWPDTEQSEGHFSLALFEDPAATCAFWGGREEPPWVEHIGTDRAGVGY